MQGKEGEQDGSGVPATLTLVGERLLLGDYTSSRDIAELRRRNVSHILAVMEELIYLADNLLDAGVRRLVIEVQDKEEEDLLSFLPSCHDFMTEALSGPTNVLLVHSFRGTGRAAVVVISWLMKAEGLSLPEALERLRKRHHAVQLNSSFQQQLLLFQKMGCVVDEENEEYQQFLKQLQATRRRTASLNGGPSSLASPSSSCSTLGAESAAAQKQPQTEGNSGSKAKTGSRRSGKAKPLIKVSDPDGATLTNETTKKKKKKRASTEPAKATESDKLLYNEERKAPKTQGEGTTTGETPLTRSSTDPALKETGHVEPASKLKTSGPSLAPSEQQEQPLPEKATPPSPMSWNKMLRQRGSTIMTFRKKKKQSPTASPNPPPAKTHSILSQSQETYVGKKSRRATQKRSEPEKNDTASSSPPNKSHMRRSSEGARNMDKVSEEEKEITSTEGSHNTEAGEEKEAEVPPNGVNQLRNSLRNIAPASIQQGLKGFFSRVNVGGEETPADTGPITCVEVCQVRHRFFCYHLVRRLTRVNPLQELPKDVRGLLKASKIPQEQMERHFNILINILIFMKKVSPQQRDPSTSLLPLVRGKSTFPFLTEEELMRRDVIDRKAIKILSQQGEGGYGRVFLAKSDAKEVKGKVAIKRVPHILDKEKKHNLREVNYLKFCNHPNIVKYYTTLFLKNELWIVMEFMEGGTLTEAVRNHSFSEIQVAYVARELLKALAWLHDHKLLHRDLKSSNIMMTIKGNIKLIDFGLCVDVSGGPRRDMVGSPFWMPPEMVRRDPHDLPADIWSFAISLLELANRHPPFQKSSLRAMFTYATEGCPDPLDEPDKWSDNFKDFLSMCLRSDPAERATAKVLLEHPFLRQVATQKQMAKLIQHIFMRHALDQVII
ncbi:serine/threonine-protein kinase BLUS1 isoform X3 [Balamuthia mandrillaris]